MARHVVMARHDVRSGALTKWRLRIVASVMILLAIALVVRALFIVYDDDLQSKINLKMMSREPTSLRLLEVKRAEVDRATKNIGSLTLDEIQDLLATTSVLAGQASIELKAQEEAWEKMKSRSEVDAATYEEVRRQLNIVSQMQSKEIIRLTGLLDEARSPSILDHIWGVFASFIVGVISSLAATFAIGVIRERKKNALARLSVGKE